MLVRSKMIINLIQHLIKLVVVRPRIKFGVTKGAFLRSLCTIILTFMQKPYYNLWLFMYMKNLVCKLTLTENNINIFLGNLHESV
jgi:hypothetical protein